MLQADKSALERELRVAFQRLQRRMFKSSAFLALSYLVAVYMLSGAYSGVVVTVLPFEPLWPVSLVSLWGLDEDQDPAACSYVFLLAMSCLAFRPMLRALFGQCFSAPAWNERRDARLSQLYNAHARAALPTGNGPPEVRGVPIFGAGFRTGPDCLVGRVGWSGGRSDVARTGRMGASRAGLSACPSPR